MFFGGCSVTLSTFLQVSSAAIPHGGRRYLERSLNVVKCLQLCVASRLKDSRLSRRLPRDSVMVQRDHDTPGWCEMNKEWSPAAVPPLPRNEQYYEEE